LRPSPRSPLFPYTTLFRSACRAAHVFDIFPPGLDRRQRIEVGGVGIIPAEIFLIDRLHIVPDVAVIAARMPRAFEAFRQRDGLGDRKSTRLNSSHSQISYA